MADAKPCKDLANRALLPETPRHQAHLCVLSRAMMPPRSWHHPSIGIHPCSMSRPIIEHLASAETVSFLRAEKLPQRVPSHRRPRLDLETLPAQAQLDFLSDSFWPRSPPWTANPRTPLWPSPSLTFLSSIRPLSLSLSLSLSP
jgi:hypothetical protein